MPSWYRDCYPRTYDFLPVACRTDSRHIRLLRAVLLSAGFGESCFKYADRFGRGVARLERVRVVGGQVNTSAG